MWVVLAAGSAVYLYNSSLFKPWYLSGQVEVYCLMSSMWPQVEDVRCGQEALSCEWLGIRIGDRSRSYRLAGSPSQPAHLPYPRRGERLAFGDARARWSRNGKTDWVAAWLDVLLPLSEGAHTHLDGHTRTHIHTQTHTWRSSSCSVSPELSRLCFTDTHSHAHPAQQSLLILTETRCDAQSRLNVSVWLKCTRPLYCFSQSMLIRSRC